MNGRTQERMLYRFPLDAASVTDRLKNTLGLIIRVWDERTGEGREGELEIVGAAA